MPYCLLCFASQALRLWCVSGFSDKWYSDCGKGEDSSFPLYKAVACSGGVSAPWDCCDTDRVLQGTDGRLCISDRKMVSYRKQESLIHVCRLWITRFQR